LCFLRRIQRKDICHELIPVVIWCFIASVADNTTHISPTCQHARYWFFFVIYIYKGYLNYSLF
jgi:hypothetical protein